MKFVTRGFVCRIEKYEIGLHSNTLYAEGDSMRLREGCRGRIILHSHEIPNFTFPSKLSKVCDKQSLAEPRFSNTTSISPIEPRSASTHAPYCPENGGLTKNNNLEEDRHIHVIHIHSSIRQNPTIDVGEAI